MLAWLIAACADSPPSMEDPGRKVLLRATSADGTHWQKLPGVLAERASSPSLVLLGEEIAVLFVADGRSLERVAWTGETTASMSIEGEGEGEGEAPALRVDPCAVPLAGGGWRLYYVAREGEADPADGAANEVRSARSADGRIWVREPGTRLVGPWVDPDVVGLPDGTYRMYLTTAARSVRSARSSDGLEFTVEPGERLAGGGVTSTIESEGGWMTVFHRPGGRGIAVARSTDGLAWDIDARPAIEPTPAGIDAGGVESASILRSDGKWHMVYAALR